MPTHVVTKYRTRVRIFNSLQMLASDPTFWSPQGLRGRGELRRPIAAFPRRYVTAIEGGTVIMGENRADMDGKVSLDSLCASYLFLSSHVTSNTNPQSIASLPVIHQDQAEQILDVI